MENCIFCKIIRGEIPTVKAYEDDEMLVFSDIAPIANIHLLAIPKEHFKTVQELDGGRAALVGRMLQKIGAHAHEWGLDGGFRIISNQGEAAGQTVPHLHFHLLGGEPLPWGN